MLAFILVLAALAALPVSALIITIALARKERLSRTSSSTSDGRVSAARPAEPASCEGRSADGPGAGGGGRPTCAEVGTEIDLEQEAQTADAGHAAGDLAMASAIVQEAIETARGGRNDPKQRAGALRHLEEILPLAQEILEQCYRRTGRGRTPPAP